MVLMGRRQLHASFEVFVMVTLATLTVAVDDVYREDLVLRGVGDHTLAHFQFTTDHDPVSADGHYNLFPKSLALALEKHGVTELHLSMTQGRWQYGNWGPPVFPSPTGLELWAWLDLPEGSEAEKNWKGLTHTLSGLFCGSVHFLEKSMASSPTFAFGPTGAIPMNSTNGQISGSVRHGILPREEACTENLTPWLKLLPCKGSVGLSALVDPHMVLAGTYHQIGLHVRPVCADADCTEMRVQLKQTLSVVTHKMPNTGVTLAEILKGDRGHGEPFPQKCSLAESSRILVDVTSDGGSQDEAVIKWKGNRFYRVHDALLPIDATSIVVGATDLPKRKVTAERQLQGFGQERGAFVMRIANLQDEPVKVACLQEIPWYIRALFSSLSLETTSTLGVPGILETAILKRKFVPAADRQRMASLELVLELPANAEVAITMRFEQGWLKLSEHPPDANRGFDVGGAVVSVIDSAEFASGGFDLFAPPNDKQYVETRLYTESALVNLPIPDFSMPYNVITFTCTALFLGWGQMIHLVQQTVTYIKDADVAKNKTLLQRIIFEVGKRFTRK